MSWNSPTTFAPTLIEVLGVTLPIKSVGRIVENADGVAGVGLEPF
jgi:hypothetical protein